MMTKQVEGFTFHFTQLEEPNKTDCSINCSLYDPEKTTFRLHHSIITAKIPNNIQSHLWILYYIDTSPSSRWHDYKMCW